MRINKRLAALLTSIAHVCSLLLVLPAATAQDVDIIPFEATWDYLFTALDDGTGSFMPADPFTANNVDFSNWTSVGFATTTLTFDDGRSASWQSGPALFGQGDSGVRYGTEFPQPGPNNRNITQYFRHEFTSTQTYNNLTMSLIVDDGAVVHLDGNPVSSMMSCCRDSTNNDYDVANPNDPRFGQFPGFRDRSTVTNGPPPGSAEGEIYTELVATLNTLLPGPHVIGLEVHQASTNSSDMRFDFRLSGTNGEETMDCDFDTNGSCDAIDIDLLTGSGDLPYASTDNTSTYDINADGIIDVNDVRLWLSWAAIRNGFADSYLLGDSNLDGNVNATDLNRLALNWRDNGQVFWSEGDFTGDSVVNSADLNELALNWRQSIPLAAVSVPEPAAFVLAALALPVFFWMNFRRRR